jgi:hypothetical protein
MLRFSTLVLCVLARAALALPSADYVELRFFEAPPENVVTWDASNLKELTPTSDGGTVTLRGRLAAGHAIFFEDHWVKADASGHFEVPIALERDPRVFAVRIVDPAREFRIYPLVYFWNRLPQGAAAAFPHRIGFAQTYAGDRPVQAIDLDSLDEARATVRIYLPPDIQIGSEAWTLLVEKDDGKSAPLKITRDGFPPPYLDWAMVKDAFLAPGEYRYRFVLRYAGKHFSGRPSRLTVYAGSHLMRHDYRSDLRFEPRQETGVLSLATAAGSAAFRTAYLGLDLTMVVAQRLLVRATAATALSGASADHAFSQLRAGLGWRFVGHSAGAAVGRPFLFQLDTLLGYSALFLGGGLANGSLAAPSVLVEPSFVFASAHRLTPWAEYATRGPSAFQRVSFGLQYAYYLRDWSIALGLTAAVDKQLTPVAGRYDLWRTGASIALLL